MPQHSDALFISWVPHHRRSEDLAELLDAQALWIAHGTPRRRASAPIRWLRQAVDTVGAVRRHRPAVVYVMSPPVLAVVCVRVALGRQATVIVDAHGKAIRRIGSERVRASFRILARMADIVVVTNQGEAARLQGRHRAVLVVHDPLGPPREVTGEDEHERPVVVFPASWESDEPIEDVFEAARRTPDVDWVITGSPPASVLARPANLRLSGRLPEEEYFALIGGASLVLALTSRADTMQRAGYDAALVGVGLVASDTNALREYFESAAVYAAPSADALVDAVRSALEASDELAASMVALASRRRVEQSGAIDVLRRRVEAIRSGRARHRGRS